MNETKQQTFPHPLISLAPASACHTMPPLLPPAVNLKKNVHTGESSASST